MKTLYLIAFSVYTVNLYAQSKNDLRSEIDRLRQDSFLQVQEYTNLNNSYKRLLIENESTNRRLYFSDSLLVSRSSEIVNLNQTISLVQNSSSVLISNLEERISILERTNDSLRSMLEELYRSEPDTINWYVDGLQWSNMNCFLKLPVPNRRFSKPIGNTLQSIDGKIKIQVLANQTHQFGNDGGPEFFSFNQATNYFKQELSEEWATSTNDWWFRGVTYSNQLAVYFLFWDELESMQGRDYGEPTWLWSNTVVIKVTSGKEYRTEFEELVEFFGQCLNSDCLVWVD